MKRDGNHPHRLIVEGSDDLFTVVNLTTKHGMNWNSDPALPWISDAKSLERALRELPVSLKVVKRLGILIDADQMLAERWKAVREKVSDLLVLPPTPPADGFVGTASNGCRFGAWIMPDNVHPGALEELLIDMMPTGNALWTYACEVSTEALGKGAAFPEKYTQKASLRTWLAWQREPGLPPGSAVERGYLQPASPLAQKFSLWFSRLFLESDPQPSQRASDG